MSPTPIEAPPAPVVAQVAVDGVERVWLVHEGDGARFKPGPVPPGRYDVQVFFEEGRATRVMTLDLAAGDVRSVRCDPRLKACR